MGEDPAAMCIEAGHFLKKLDREHEREQDVT